MGIPPRAARRDENEPEIVEMLRRLNASVQPLSIKGIPDLLVGYDHVNYLIEVKTAKGKLTPDQIDIHSTWKGQIGIARTVQEALAILGIKST